MSTNKIQCTVGILTFNSATTLKRALESVRDFAEIIVCDGGSTDDTLSLARAYGAKVLSQDPAFRGEDNKLTDFGGVRNQMIESAAFGWFFSLDSDELLTEALADEIRSIISSGHPAAAFWVPRKYMLESTVIECAATYPTRQVRFFHRDSVTGFIKSIHERVNVREGMPLLALKKFMLVPIDPSPAFHRAKWVHYIELEAARRGTLTVRQWLGLCAENLKVSLLYAVRFVRNALFCRGARLPWRLEWERHVYHVNLCRRFWRLVRRSS